MGRQACLPRAAVLLVALAALAGCGSGLDEGQARLCRSVIPALLISGASDGTPLPTAIIVEELRGRTRQEVRVAYRLSDDPRRIVHRITCSFDVAGAAVEALPRHLAAVSIESRPMSPIRLHLLKRFWLEANAGSLIDPAPIRGAATAPEVAAPMARGAQHALLAAPGIAVYALLAASYALVYGLSGRINLAFGQLAVAGGYGALLGMIAAGAGTLASIGSAMAVALWTAASLAAITGGVILVPLLAERSQVVLIASLSLAVALEEALRVVQGARVQWVPPLFNAPLAVLRSGEFIVATTALALIVIGVAAAAVGALLVVMHRSRFGRQWRAVADDASAAALVGIDARRTAVATFAVSGALAGLVGLLTTLLYGGIGSAGGMVLGLKALLAAVLGGIGSVGGAVVGGLVLGVLEGAWAVWLPIEHRDAFIFTLLVVALVLRPGGLVGDPEVAPRNV